MTANRGWIEQLFIRIQNVFLDNPTLTLTLPQAQRRFRSDAVTCEAILAALLDAGVLAKTPEGAYVRFFPRLASETNRISARADVATSSPLGVAARRSAA